MLEIRGKYTTATVMIDDVEESCLKQIYTMVNNPVFTEHIVIQPDTHSGKGSVIGFTMLLGSKIIPAIVGSDIGCGMLSFNVGDSITENKDKLLKIDEKIRNVIPFGSNVQQKSAVPSKYFEKNFPWSEANDIAKKFIVNYNNKFGTDFKFVEFDYDWFLNKQKSIGMRQDAELAIGTLGGGNHFIEVGKSVNTGEVWITIHCGSRNFGKEICDFHQNKAKKNLEYKRNVGLKSKIEEIRKTSVPSEIEFKIKEAKKELGIDFTDININGMEFLEGQDAINYFTDMIFTQVYAKFNRKRISENITKTLGIDIKESIECNHNYINFDDMIIRKGSISSYVGEKIIIPFNMADGLLICEGKSNPEWNFSAPHGAGRLMSRGEANKNIDIEKFKFRMKDIVSTSVGKSTLDEAPQAYKNPKMIESAIEPTVTILDRVKPILNLKDGGDSTTWKERKEMAKMQKNRDLDRREMRKIKNS
jgi:tRNA-splicing ligase RtcB (3'-phosphate/5'-hydroxy nucleic acid ligase)